MRLRKDFLWLIMFGTLAGLNETVLGSMHIPNKSVILSTITLVLFAAARYLFRAKGTTLLVAGVAVLFKLNDVGVCGCRPEALIMLGIGFELFASLMIKKDTEKKIIFFLVPALTALLVFPVFALMMRYVMLDEYWFNAKFFTQYIFIKGPLTAVASALFSFLTVLALKPLVKNYTNISAQKPYIINGALGVVIIAIWLIGFFSV